jgi:hypothetical protein
VFAPLGEIFEVSVIRDKLTSQCKGYGFVFFVSADAQQRALSEAMRGQFLVRGRALRTSTCEQKTTLVVAGLPADATPEALTDEVRPARPRRLPQVWLSVGADPHGGGHICAHRVQRGRGQPGGGQRAGCV